jgi:hypothetical protein
MNTIADIDELIEHSTSITSLSIYRNDIASVNEASRTAIKEQISDLRLYASKYGYGNDNTRATIIAGSKVMKKVILDGLDLDVADQVKRQGLETLKIVKEACKKKNVELWMEKFDGGNGKVDLEK